MVVDYCLSCKELTALQSCKNIYSLYKILMDSWWSPHTCHGVNLDFIRTLSGLLMESIRSLSGVHQEYQDFIRTPDELHQDSWGSVTYSTAARVLDANRAANQAFHGMQCVV